MRALYYPHLDIEYSMTPTGMLVSNYPQLYTKPVTERTIAKVNVQQAIPEIIERLTGQLMAKEEFVRTSGLFKLLLEGAEDDSTYRRAVTNLCEKSIVFQQYLVYADVFEEKTLPLIRRVIQPLRNGLDEKLHQYRIILNSFPKSKACMQTHDQLFYSIPLFARIPDFPIPIEYIES